MNKIVQIDRKAKKELDKFPKEAQIKLRALINILLLKGRLEPIVIILSAFMKKTRKTPLIEIQKAQKRLQRYL